MSTKEKDTKSWRHTGIVCGLIGVGGLIGYGIRAFMGNRNKLAKIRGTMVDEYLLKKGNNFIKELEEIRIETKRKFPFRAGMQTDYDECYLFKWLLQLTKAKYAIEIGVFTGSSALAIALGLPKDGKLVAFDVDAQYTNVAKKYWKKCGVNDKIDLKLDGGIKGLDNLLKNKNELKKYDFAYVDAVKTEYKDYYERLLKLIRIGGIIAFDNVLSRGNVADIGCNDKRAKSLREFNQFIVDDKRVDCCMISIADGVTLCRVIE